MSSGFMSIPKDPAKWEDYYTLVLIFGLGFAATLGMTLWVIDYANITAYKINEKGFASHRPFRKGWTIIEWKEITYCRHYRRWTGEMENFICFSNYELDPEHPKVPINSGEYRDVMFIIPLSRRGLEAIRRFVPDDQLRLLAKDPWLFKSDYAKELKTIFEERNVINVDLLQR